eukprot:scaffold848_cov247-Pinguiococcus_pyrenoidosus.AAC.5
MQDILKSSALHPLLSGAFDLLRDGAAAWILRFWWRGCQAYRHQKVRHLLESPTRRLSSSSTDLIPAAVLVDERGAFKGTKSIPSDPSNRHIGWLFLLSVSLPNSAAEDINPLSSAAFRCTSQHFFISPSRFHASMRLFQRRAIGAGLTRRHRVSHGFPRSSLRILVLAQVEITDVPILLVKAPLLHELQAMLLGLFQRHAVPLVGNLLRADDPHVRVHQEEDHDPPPSKAASVIHHLPDFVHVRVWEHEQAIVERLERPDWQRADFGEFFDEMGPLLRYLVEEVVAFVLREGPLEAQRASLDAFVALGDVHGCGDDVLVGHAFNVPNPFVLLAQLQLVVDDLRDHLQAEPA